MLEFLRYDAEKRVRGSIYLSIGMAALAGMILWVYPSFSESLDGDELLSAYPPELLQLFDVQTMTSLEGFLAFEFYVFGWVILLGLYTAYSAASIVAEDVDRGRMDAVLALPVSRPRLLAERFAALGVPILAVNAAIPPLLVVGSRLIGESLSLVDVVVLHLLSIPYLFACAGIGAACSVGFDRVGVAQRVALGVTFGLYLTESLVENTDYEPVGAIAPMRYYDPNGVLLDGTYDLLGAAVLIGMTLGLLVASGAWFVRKDI